jgi:hypothetical protein
VLGQSTTPRPKFDAFEVATLKPMDPDAKAGRCIIMQGNHRFVEKAYTLKLLIAAAYDLNTRTISGGPGGSNPLLEWRPMRLNSVERCRRHPQKLPVRHFFRRFSNSLG